MEIFRQKEGTDDPEHVRVEIEYRGDEWQVVAEDPDERYYWCEYRDKVIHGGGVPTGRKGEIAPRDYYTDEDLRDPVTSAWLKAKAGA